MPPRGCWTESGDLNVPTGRTGACCWPPGERAGCCPAPTMPRTPPIGEFPAPMSIVPTRRDPLLKASNASTRLTFAPVLQVKYHYPFLHLTDAKMKFEGAKRTAQGHPRTWRQDAKPGCVGCGGSYLQPYDRPPLCGRPMQPRALLTRLGPARANSGGMHLHPSVFISGPIMTDVATHSPTELVSIL